MSRVQSEDTAVADVPPLRRAFRDGAALDVRRGDVHLRVDGARPFLVVVRGTGPDDPLVHLVRGEAAYLRAERDVPDDVVRRRVREVAEAGVAAHGAFLVMEVWAGSDYRVLAPDGPASGTTGALARGLQELAGDEPVTVVPGEDRHPPGREPLLSVSALHEMGALLLGVQVAESWRDEATGTSYPVHLRRVGHVFSRVLRNTAFEFLRVQTGTQLPSYRALGRRTLGEPVWEADRALAEIDASFDPLLLVAPVNEDAAWAAFRDGGFRQEPAFHYRLLPVEPDLLKRRLYAVRLEDVEDPAAWKLLHDKREELDRQISLLTDRGTPEFLHSAIRLFGHVEPGLRERAESILAAVELPEESRPRRRVGAEEFADLARREFDHYRSRYPEFRSEVQVRPDLVGLMVSSGRLLVGRGLTLPPDRVEALLQHEVGTHVLTYVNGSAQPFLQLAHGFADYDETQEGLGVLAEYLVGGLTPARMRLLAARVVAVADRIEGASFIEGFDRLRDHGFTDRTSFDITARVHASGGFTRDHIYLRGFMDIVHYLRDGGALEPLYVGKIAARHLEVVEELRERAVLRGVPLLPRFLDDPAAQQRLRALRDGLPVTEMVDAEGASE